MKTLLSFEKEAYHIVVFDSNTLDYSRIMEEIMRGASKGYRKFTIHVISNTKPPFYLEKLRNLIQNNIAYTLTIRHYGHDNVKDLLRELQNLPHKVLAENKIF